MSLLGSIFRGQGRLDRVTRRAVAQAEALLGACEQQPVPEPEAPPNPFGLVDVEAWLRRQLGVSLKRAVRAERGSRPEKEVVLNAGAAIRRILAQQQEEHSKLTPLVGPVLCSPPDRRWQMVTSLPELRRGFLVSRLLDSAELFAEEQGPEAVEELALATLHLAERLSIGIHRRALVFDLFAQAWLLRVRVALERRERGDAAFALELAQLYQERGTGDALLLFATARASAWLVWLGGDLELAAECFRAMELRAAQVRDPDLVAEAKAWRELVQSGQAGATAEAAERSSASITERVETTARRFRLPTA